MQPEFYYVQTATQMSDSLNEFLVALLLLIIIFVAIAIWLFAKWLTAGPWFKKKFNKMFKRNKDDSSEGINVVKGKVVVDQNYIDEIDEKIKNAETPQELLELQLLKETNEKERIKLEKEIAEKDAEKLAKVEKKQDKARIKSEMKEKQKEFKANEKEKKKEIKKEEK